MTNEKKDTIQIISACSMLALAAFLSIFAFFITPQGEIHDSVLWIFAQILMYAGSSFGIASYVKSQLKKYNNDNNNNQN